MHRDQHLDQKRVLRDLKGAPLSIIIALMLSGTALTSQQLQSWTDYTDKASIRKGLARLQEYGAVKSSGGRYGKKWMLDDGINQLPLPFIGLGEGGFSALPSPTVIELSTGGADLSTGKGQLSTVEGDFSALPLIKKVKTYSYSYDGHSSFPTSPNVGKRDFSPSQGKYPPTDREPPDENILALCAELKIAPPASTWLAGWSWVTADYLIAHVDKVLAEKQQLGLAVYRIAKQQAQPPLTRCFKCESQGKKGHIINGICYVCIGKIMK